MSSRLGWASLSFQGAAAGSAWLEGRGGNRGRDTAVPALSCPGDKVASARLGLWGRSKAQITHGRAATEPQYGRRRPSRTQACFTRGVSANGSGSHRLTRASPQAPAQLQGTRRPSSY